MKCEKCGHEDESLAVLADSKGCWQVSYQSWKNIKGSLRPSIVLLFREDPNGEMSRVANGDTFLEAESKARAYLNSLPDKEK